MTARQPEVPNLICVLNFSHSKLRTPNFTSEFCRKNHRAVRLSRTAQTIQLELNSAEGYGTFGLMG
jgi:hypothetical protein